MPHAADKEAERFMREWTDTSAHGGCEDYRERCGEDDWAGACDARVQLAGPGVPRLPFTCVGLS